jgi:adenylate kinase family enzyme
MSYLDFNSLFVAGFPRTIEQAKQLNTKQTFDVVIHLDVPFSEIKRRIEVRSMKLILEIKSF